MSPLHVTPRAVLCALGIAAGAQGWSAEQAAKIDVDTSALARLGVAPREDNPYRGDARAAAVGETAFHQACARCHVLESSGGVGPDLRMLNGYCRRIANAAKRQACLRDQDHYFIKTVLEGKTIVGVAHMPAWRGFLSQEAIWAIRTYIESKEKAVTGESDK